MSRDHDQLSALVDGELDHETREQLLAHIAHCAQCREVVDAERAVKSVLAGLAPPEPSAGVLARAGAVAATDGAVPAASAAAGGSGWGRSGLPGFGQRFGGFPIHRDRRTPQDQPGHRVPASPMMAGAGGPSVAMMPPTERRSHRLRYGVAGALGAAGVCFAMAFVAVAEATPEPELTVVPPSGGAGDIDGSGERVVEDANSVEVPMSDPGAVTSSFVQDSVPGARD